MEKKIRIIPGEIDMVPIGGESGDVTAKYDSGGTAMVVVKFPDIAGISGLCGCLEVGKMRLVLQDKKWYPAFVLDASRWFHIVQNVEDMMASREVGELRAESGVIAKMEGENV